MAQHGMYPSRQGLDWASFCARSGMADLTSPCSIFLICDSQDSSGGPIKFMQRGHVRDDFLVGAIEDHITYAKLFGSSAFALSMPRVLPYPQQEIKGHCCHVTAGLDLG
jgi:hypothetical protein